jgi:beta-ribofuranosylaminobenzene 5'-phosphate synthase
MVRPEGQTVFVETPGRLHFGVLDLRGTLGRWFGGIGTAAPAPTLLVSATHAGALVVDGEDATRARAFAASFFARYRPAAGARVRVHRALPSHVGLGSGTQLALAVARALAELYGLDTATSGLVRAVGRARRSAIGTWTFDGGGLVVEGGRRPDRDDPAPLLARLGFPSTWRCVVAIPSDVSGLSGGEEDDAFARLPPPPERDAERVAHLVLMSLLPALVDGDLPTFGRALRAIQTMTGEWFAAGQGGTFASGPTEALVRHMVEWGASGVGQSSWGPAVYGIVEGDDAARRLADRVRGATDGLVVEGPFRESGARVWRE